MLLPLNIRAQIVLSNIGAKNEGLGSPNSLSFDESSLWRNPAALAAVEHTVISSNIRRISTLQALAKSVVVSTTTKIGSFATGMTAFGDDIYNEQAASLGFANKLGLASIGIRADVIQLRIDGNNTRRTVGISIGSIAKISSRFSIGLYAHNINLPAWSGENPLPVLLSVGVQFKPVDNFMVIAEVEKDTDFDPTMKGGLEYSFRKKFFARTGFNLFPNAAFGGIGLRTWRLNFDYAARFGYLPGYSHQLSISFRTGKHNQQR